MAGKELKAAEKTVLKHSRDRVVEKNLVNNSEKRINEHTEEAVLKVEKLTFISYEKRSGEDISHVEPTMCLLPLNLLNMTDNEE